MTVQFTTHKLGRMEIVIEQIDPVKDTDVSGSVSRPVHVHKAPQAAPSCPPVAQGWEAGGGARPGVSGGAAGPGAGGGARLVGG
jgi:hypothetical protein